MHMFGHTLFCVTCWLFFVGDYHLSIDHDKFKLSHLFFDLDFMGHFRREIGMASALPFVIKGYLSSISPSFQESALLSPPYPTMLSF